RAHRGESLLHDGVLHRQPGAEADARHGLTFVAEAGRGARSHGRAPLHARTGYIAALTPFEHLGATMPYDVAAVSRVQYVTALPLRRAPVRITSGRGGALSGPRVFLERDESHAGDDDCGCDGHAQRECFASE